MPGSRCPSRLRLGPLRIRIFISNLFWGGGGQTGWPSGGYRGHLQVARMMLNAAIMFGFRQKKRTFASGNGGIRSYILCPVFLPFLVFVIGHIARYAPSSKFQNQQKYRSKLPNLFFHHYLSFASNHQFRNYEV